MRSGSRQEKTRAALVEAAVQVFSVYGLRRTSMEQLAEAAQVAKATAYAYFPNKDAIFAAVVDRVLEQMAAASAHAVAAAPDAVSAVRDGLVAKYALEWQLVHASPHARELLEAGEGVAGAAMQAAHARHTKALVGLLVKAGVKRGEAPELAATLFDAFEGLTAKATSLAQLEARGALLVDRVLSAR